MGYPLSRLLSAEPLPFTRPFTRALGVSKFTALSDTLAALRSRLETADTYVVSGDSTRDNTYNEGIAYYTSMFGKAGITVVDNAASGQTGEGWADGTATVTAAQAIAAIPGTGSTTVLEFSFGINDTSSSGSETPAEQLAKWKPGIDAVLAAKPDTLVFFVEPVMVGATARNASMVAAYQLLNDTYPQFHLVYMQDYMAQIYDGLDAVETRVFYFDATHPNETGTIRVVNKILNEILPDSLLSTVVLDNNHWNGSAELVVSSKTLTISGEYWNSSGTTSIGATWGRFDILPVTGGVGNFIRITHDGSRDDVRLLGSSGIGDYLGVVATPDSGSAPGTYTYDLTDANVFFVGANYTSTSQSPGASPLIEEVQVIPGQSEGDLTQPEINVGLTGQRLVNPVIAAPTNVLVPTISGTVELGDTLTAADGTWSGVDLVFTYQWKRDGVDISGATSSTYTIVVADDAADITVAVTATNGGGSLEATSAATTVADFAAPVFAGGAGSISGTLEAGQTLTYTPATGVTGNPTPSSTYSWKRVSNDTVLGSGLTLVAPEGTGVYVTETSTNAIGSTTQDSANSGAISAAPSVETFVITSIGPQPSAGANVPIEYTLTGDDTIEFVQFLSTDPDPVAADFDTGATSGYIDLGPAALTTTGSPVNLAFTDVSGSYKLAGLPSGGGDADVEVSAAFTLTAPSGGGLDVDDDFSSLADDALLTANGYTRTGVQNGSAEFVKIAGDFAQINVAATGQQLITNDTDVSSVDHYGELEYEFKSNANANRAWVIAGFNGTGGYSCRFNASGSCEISAFTHDGLTSTSLTTGTWTLAVDTVQTFRIERDQTAGTVTAFVDGVQVAQATSETTYSGGLKIGMGARLASGTAVGDGRAISISGDAI